jgi:hypothetical protein
MELKIRVTPQDLGFSYESVKSLLRKINEVENNKENITKLSFHLDAKIDVKDSFEPSLTMLWRIAEYYRKLDCPKEFVYKGSTQKLLHEAHFLDRLTGKKTSFLTSVNVPIHYETFSPYRPKKTSSVDLEIENVISETTKKSFDLKNDFHKEVKTHMFEIINNAFDHSESESDAGVASFLRVEKNGDKGRLSFCVADMGQGVKMSFKKNPGLWSKFQKLSDAEVLSEITKLRVSCNPTSSRHPNYEYSNGGLGLYFLKEFVKAHKNSAMVLISNKGYYYIDSSGREKIRNLEDVNWPGLVVHFVTNLKQQKNEEYLRMIRESVGIDNDQLIVV